MQGRPLPVRPVFVRHDLLRLGWTDSAITRAARSGRLVRVRHGVFAHPETPHAPAHAAVVARPSAVVSHRSALEVHALPIVGERPVVAEVTVPPDGTGSLRDGALHRATLGEADVVRVGGIPVTSVARTLVDVARAHRLRTSVPAIDAALHRRLVTLDELEAVTLGCWNWPGIRRALRAIRLADGRSESPLESVSRLTIRSLGLPPPDLQPVVLDPVGRAVARLDFYWDDLGVAGEADGRSKYDGRDVLSAEKDRQEAAEDLGLTFARWGWRHTVRPPLLRDKIVRAFARGAERRRSGLPRSWSVQRT